MPPISTVLRPQSNWNDLFFYKKSEVLYQLTVRFCARFLPAHGDRTVDQMVQAARSGKQNIVEGLADGSTSTEMQLKLLNVARASLQELREDYVDYLKSHKLPIWNSANPRYDGMLAFCREHNLLEEYELLFDQWDDEELCNVALTLCRMTDKMMCSFLQYQSDLFVAEGGIRERMHAARTGYREQQDAELKQLRAENTRLLSEQTRLREEKAHLLSENERLCAENARLLALLHHHGIDF